MEAHVLNDEIFGFKREMQEKLATVTDYPMFSSMHKFMLEGKTYEEWLKSLPADLLEEYAEHNMRRKKSTEREELIDQDYLATVMTLHAMETKNEPIETEEISKKMGMFQTILCGLSINKTIEKEWGKPDFLLKLNLGTWHTFLAGDVQANPDIEFVDKSDKPKTRKRK